MHNLETKAIKKVSIFANNQKAESSALVHEIHSYLKKRGIADDIYLTIAPTDIKKVDKDTDLAIVLGGDGTVLSCARLLHAYGIPMLAVNLGTFGFITEVAKNEWQGAFEEYEKGIAQVSRRVMIRVGVNRKEKRVFQSHSLNEITISSSGLSKMISLHLYINETLAGLFRSDGVIVSTPTGSTGYSLAAGGPILDVHLDALIINPICPFTLSNRPLVISGDDIIKARVDKNQKTEIALSVDGQVLFLLEEEDEIVIEKSRSKALLIESTKRNYYEVIRDKLNWSGDCMLESLHIKNLALIDSIHIDFSPGFTILSGETGAGKSIILGALSLLFGDKVDSSLIRSGTDEASVSAVISLSPQSAVRTYVAQKGLEIEDDELIITRNVKQTGRGTIYVQGQPMTRNDLSVITHLLFDIHGQSEHQSLLISEKQRTILDSYSNSEPLIKNYLISYNELKEVEKEIIRVKDQIQDAAKEEDYLSFVVKEIESASIKKGEDEELLEEITMLTQYELLSDNLTTSYHALKGEEGNNGALLSLRSSYHSIKKISSIDSSLKELENRLEPLILEVEDITLFVREKLSSMSFSQSRLDSLNERLAMLQRLKKKYGPSLEQVLQFLEKTKQKLSYTTDSDEIIEELIEKKKKITASLINAASLLTQHRKKKADELSHLIALRLKELNMEHVVFTIHIEDGEYTPNGKDLIEFMFSANLGEPVKKLKEIASGGELSRLMLAIKRVLGENDNIETFIFDEVDNGIGGAVAYSVGEQIAQIAKNHQVIVISHLASIASRADNHLVVKKISDAGRTYTTMYKVEKDERVKEIARMLSGQEENSEALKHAATLLAQNEHY